MIKLPKHELYEILPIETDKDDIKQPLCYRRGVLGKIPTRTFIIGQSGSGKTNLLVSMFRNKSLYGGYFDKKHIFVISPTAESGLDDSYKNIGCDEKNVFSPEYFAALINQLYRVSKKSIKKRGHGRSPQIAILIDDCISYKKELINTQLFKRLLVNSRHYNISVFVLSQCYHEIPKSCRLNFTDIFFFQNNQQETEALIRDFTPPTLGKKEMTNLINDATDGSYNFLYIATRRKKHERYRKNLNTIIDYTKYRL